MILAEMSPPKGLIIGAPGSGSGKTIITLGLIAALSEKGLVVAGAKTGPDYIDPSFSSHASGFKSPNLDPWAMGQDRLRSLAANHAKNADILLIEGVMGLFDGALDGTGSTGDLAASLGLSVLLVVDAARQSQSIAALVSGFANWRADVPIAGIILNNVASEKHQKILRLALNQLDIPLVGIIPREAELEVPNRHLGLVLADEMGQIDRFTRRAATLISTHCDLDIVQDLARPLCIARTSFSGSQNQKLPPLGQHIAIARDGAFAFIYAHWLKDWQDAGASFSFFSPLANQAPDKNADAVFLPGGYPELHGAQLAAASHFMAGLRAARDRGALIYGECGGFMVLGEYLTDKNGQTHKMAGLLSLSTRIDRPRRILGYRKLSHSAPLPWPARLLGHEFHYSSSSEHNLPPLFSARDALGDKLDQELGVSGAVDGRVMGSYAHVIDCVYGDKS